VWAVIHLAICVAGIVASVGSYNDAGQQAEQTGAGTYTVWYGAIAFGGFFFLRNLYRSIKLRRVARELDNVVALEMLRRASDFDPDTLPATPNVAAGQPDPRSCADCGELVAHGSRFCGACGVSQLP
jgi:hypothetical protein